MVSSRELRVSLGEKSLKRRCTAGFLHRATYHVDSRTCSLAVSVQMGFDDERYEVDGQPGREHPLSEAAAAAAAAAVAAATVVAAAAP